MLLTTRRAIGPDSLADVYGKNENIPVLNTVVQNWENAGVASASGFMLLGSTGHKISYKPFKGSIAELLVFNRAPDYYKICFAHRQLRVYSCGDSGKAQIGSAFRHYKKRMDTHAGSSSV